MAYKKIIPNIYLKDEKAYRDISLKKLIGDGDAVNAATNFSDNGADAIIVIDLSDDDISHEKAIGIIRNITKAIDIPVISGGNVKRAEDVKKYLYAGSRIAFLNDNKESNLIIMKDLVNRFGKDKIGLFYTGADFEAITMAKDFGLACVITTDLIRSERPVDDFAGTPLIIETATKEFGQFLTEEDVIGITGSCINKGDHNFISLKRELASKGFSVNTFKSSIPFSEFKLNNDGMIPVIVQDYKTDEVLMLAYMNEESYNMTINTGLMTYFSRSRQEIWVKGLTSGHFQYVRSLEIDCDNDTILAKVKQIGAACHTGNRSCFYRNLVSTDYSEKNPLKVFNNVMDVIQDRKINPKEGSYTNYLFDKGIDKILKKCGEEAAEIIIAAKNVNPEDIKYEISDFLYHLMVLMALKGLTWDDIIRELSNR